MLIHKIKKTKKFNIILFVFLSILSLSIGITLAYFFSSDFSSSLVQMSGKVHIEAIGDGDLSIEDNERCNLVVDLDGYDVLIPGMDISMPANVKVYKSSTSPLLRARLNIDILEENLEDIYSADLSIAQNMYQQLVENIEDNGWYLHTDSYFYYVGTNTPNSEAGITILQEVNVADEDKVVNFIDKKVKFPTFVTSNYSGLGVKFKITFQGIQNYIPDEQGYKLPNTINNSLKIFNSFWTNNNTTTSEEYFTITTVNGVVTIAPKEGMELPETVVLPSEDSSGKPITHISADFGNSTTIKNLIVPSSYTSLDAGCFQNNSTIETIDLSATSITDIPKRAFMGSSIEEVVLPTTVKKIDENSFEESALSSIILPEGLETIDFRAFFGCKLTSLYIPKSVKTIIATSLKLPQLKTIIVSPDNTNFYDYNNICLISNSGNFVAYAVANPAVEFTVPEGVTNIDTYAFSGCSSLRIVNFPSTLVSTSSHVFTSCNNLSKINTKSKVRYGAHLMDGALVEEMTLNYTVERKTFSKLYFLKTVTFADNVTTVGDVVFEDCYNFETLIFEGVNPPTFATSNLHTGNTPSTFKIYVPDSAVSTYKAVANLSQYKNNIYGISEYNG